MQGYIKSEGLLNPLIVRPSESGGYELISGYHRYEAVKKLSAKEWTRNSIPCVVKAMTDEEAISAAVVDNVSRKDLTLFEMAMGFKKLKDESCLTIEKIAVSTGKSKGIVSRYINVIEKLPDEIRKSIENGNLDFGVGVSLVDIEKDKNLMGRVIDKIRSRNYKVTVSETREMIRNLKEERAFSRTEVYGKSLGYDFMRRIKYKSTKKGIKVTCDFESVGQLQDAVLNWAKSLKSSGI